MYYPFHHCAMSAGPGSVAKSIGMSDPDIVSSDLA